MPRWLGLATPNRIDVVVLWGIRLRLAVAKYYLHRASVHNHSSAPDVLTDQVHYQAALSDYAEDIRLDPKNWNALASRYAFHYDFLNCPRES